MGIIPAPSGGASVVLADSTNAVKLASGRKWIYGPAGGGADSYIWLDTTGLDLSAFNGPIYLMPGADSPIYAGDGGDGIILPAFTAASPPVTEEAGLLFTDNALGANRVRLGLVAGDSTGLGLWHLTPNDGFAPAAFPIGFVQNGTYTTARDLVANHGTLAIPFVIPTAMHIAAVQFWNTDTTLARECEIAIWRQMNDGAGDNLLVKLKDSQDYGSWTASAASLKGVSYASGVYAFPGVHWVTIKNTHASNTLGIGYAAGSTQMPVNLGQTKTLAAASFDGSTLDFTAATWTKVTDIHAVVIKGKAFGQSGAF